MFNMVGTEEAETVLKGAGFSRRQYLLSATKLNAIFIPLHISF